MRDDGEFFKSAQEIKQVTKVEVELIWPDSKCCLSAE